jgi:hypothetical protein
VPARQRGGQAAIFRLATLDLLVKAAGDHYGLIARRRVPL